MSDKQCRGPDCDRTWVARQLCGTHYQQLKEGKPLTPIRVPKTLEESVEEFSTSAQKRATTSQKVTKEAVRDSATSYDAKVTEEAWESWLMAHDASVLMIAANTFAKDAPTSWRQDAAYELAEMARDRREGR